MNNIREQIKDKKRIVVKIGSSSLQHAETGDLDYIRLEKLVRELCDISNQGKEVVLVTSGAIAAGKQAVHLKTTEGQTQAESMAIKQACSAIGQARLMMTYQKLFAEYNQVAAQVRYLVDGVAAGPGKFDIRGFGGAAMGGYKQLSIRLFWVADIVNGRFQR